MGRGETGQKAPAYQYYPRDFELDTRMLTNEVTGAYIRFLNIAHFAEPRGSVSYALETWAIFWGTSVGGARSIIDDLFKNGISHISVTRNDVKESYNGGNNGGATLEDGVVTIQNNRMYREWKKKEGNRLRQKRHRDRSNNDEGGTNQERMNNGQRNGIVTLHSSPSSSITPPREGELRTVASGDVRDGRETESPKRLDVPDDVQQKAVRLFGNIPGGGVLQTWGAVHGWDAVREALQRAGLAGKGDARYVEGILRRMKAEGWTTGSANLSRLDMQPEAGAAEWRTGTDLTAG